VQWPGYDISNYFMSKTVEGYRVVESQQHVTTLCLTDSPDEHDILERMIEASKPPKPADCEIDDYLLFTPFRYPPLHDGTRFGSAAERSLFYGSVAINTAFSEVAYRRFKFIDDSTADFEPFQVHYTSFIFIAFSTKCVDLTYEPFALHRNDISHRTNYKASQMLGKLMRDCHTELFIYDSARTEGLNIGVFTPQIFTKRSSSHKQWICHTDKNSVTFYDYDREKKPLLFYKNKI
jgi:hypothetical protein